MKKATMGNDISFKRDNRLIKGTVTKVSENSVIVEISEADMKKLKIPNHQTVVNHKNYKVI